MAVETGPSRQGDPVGEVGGDAVQPFGQQLPGEVRINPVLEHHPGSWRHRTWWWSGRSASGEPQEGPLHREGHQLLHLLRRHSRGVGDDGGGVGRQVGEGLEGDGGPGPDPPGHQHPGEADDQLSGRPPCGRSRRRSLSASGTCQLQHGAHGVGTLHHDPLALLDPRHRHLPVREDDGVHRHRPVSTRPPPPRKTTSPSGVRCTAAPGRMARGSTGPRGTSSVAKSPGLTPGGISTNSARISTALRDSSMIPPACTTTARPRRSGSAGKRTSSESPGARVGEIALRDPPGHPRGDRCVPGGPARSLGAPPSPGGIHPEHRASPGGPDRDPAVAGGGRGGPSVPGCG